MKTACAYKCPVCSYRDEAEFPAGACVVDAACPYCDTTLVLERKSEDCLFAGATVK